MNVQFGCSCLYDDSLASYALNNYWEYATQGRQLKSWLQDLKKSANECMIK